MKASLARRLFRTIFSIVVVNVVVTLLAVEFIYEDVEDNILRLELGQERAFLEQHVTGARIQEWNTALLSATYVPDGESWNPPRMFVGREAPFFQEVEFGDATYLISIDRTENPPGIFYLARDISLLEDRESTTQVWMAVLGTGVVILGFVLARLGTRRVVGPLQSLARHIARIEPGTSLTRLTTPYEDEELANIAATLNELLVALDAYVRGEKSLVSLASHELRTPVAVIAGALDVLEQRGSLGTADQRTVARIRRAADEMRADVEALLKLARTAVDDQAAVSVDLAECIGTVLAELESGDPEQRGRVDCLISPNAPTVCADPALVRMLLRNLIQNAIRHTRDRVRIEIDALGVSIADGGVGLPAEILARLVDHEAREVPDHGLGLFIVRLICERLGWELRVPKSDAAGTAIRLVFLPEGERTAAPMGQHR